MWIGDPMAAGLDVRVEMKIGDPRAFGSDVRVEMKIADLRAAGSSVSWTGCLVLMEVEKTHILSLGLETSLQLRCFNRPMRLCRGSCSKPLIF